MDFTFPWLGPSGLQSLGWSQRRAGMSRRHGGDGLIVARSRRCCLGYQGRATRPVAALARRTPGHCVPRACLAGCQVIGCLIECANLRIRIVAYGRLLDLLYLRMQAIDELLLGLRVGDLREPAGMS